MDVTGKRVLVVGLARSGFAVARALARRGAVVTVSDNKPPATFQDVLPELIKNKVGLELGSQRVETFLRNEMIVTSPGVPWDLPQLQAARDRMIPIYPEVEAASWFLEGIVVGITGSNGKTTTTSLLGDMLKASGFPTYVGGNIGNALSAAVDHAQPGTRFVTELSSFQLEGINEFRPHVAVMLNLSPNHLDRHPSLEAYSQAKRQIFRNQGGQDYAVLNADDPWVAGLREGVPSRPVFFSRRRELPNGVFVSEGKVCYRVRHLERVLFETRDVPLRGDFNLEDVLAATTAACLLGADFTAIRKAVRAFKAVEHRLEFVRTLEGVDFYNNSKATSVDATLKSLEAFERGVHLIMGGKDKGAPYTPLLPLIKERVRDVLVIGAAAPLITQHIAGATEVIQAGDLATAVYQAFVRSRPGDTVLLAPACSSFDQFKDYEERGRVFKELVKRLAHDVAVGRVIRDVQSEVRSPKSGVQRPELPKPGPGAGVRNLESGILNVESGTPAAPNAESSVPGTEAPPPGAEAMESASEPQLSSPESRTPSPEFRTVRREPRAPTPAPRPPHHIELSYVYEVDAVETSEPESQAVADDVPVISIAPGKEEAVEDEVLPFEAREKTGSEVRRPESEVQQRQCGVRSPASGVEEKPFEVRGPKADVGRKRSGTRGPKSGVKKTPSEIRDPQSEVRDTPSEVRSPESGADKEASEVDSPKSEVEKTESEARSPESGVLDDSASAQRSKQPKLSNGDSTEDK